jgi:hypothetical protein
MKNSIYKKLVLIIFTLGCLPVNAPAQSAGPVTESVDQKDRPWGLTVYHGILTDATLSETLTFDADYNSDFKFWVVALSKRLYEYSSDLDFEIEGQIAKHSGGQDHMEFNGVLIARWKKFPWDGFVDTSTAFGAGLSYATDTPVFEEINYENTNQLLGYLLMELTFALPSTPQWNLIGRIHHRSGAGGTFNDVRGASNSMALGLKYQF